MTYYIHKDSWKIRGDRSMSLYPNDTLVYITDTCGYHCCFYYSNALNTWKTDDSSPGPQICNKHLIPVDRDVAIIELIRLFNLPI